MMLGTVVTLTAYPAADWTFSGWSGDLSGTTNPTTITMSGNKTVTATFTQLPPCYALTLSHTGNGTDPTASPASSTGCTSGKYVAGESITLTAAPDSGWQVSSWSGTNNDSSTSTSNTVTMPAAPRTATVNYTQIPVTCYALTLSHTGNGADPTASPTNSTGCSAGQYVANESITLTASPDYWLAGEQLDRYDQQHQHSCNQYGYHAGQRALGFGNL